jgi:hypothetical protein
MTIDGARSGNRPLQIRALLFLPAGTASAQPTTSSVKYEWGHYYGHDLTDEDMRALIEYVNISDDGKRTSARRFDECTWHRCEGTVACGDAKCANLGTNISGGLR